MRRRVNERASSKGGIHPHDWVGAREIIASHMPFPFPKDRRSILNENSLAYECGSNFTNALSGGSCWIGLQHMLSVGVKIWLTSRKIESSEA